MLVYCILPIFLYQIRYTLQAELSTGLSTFPNERRNDNILTDAEKLEITSKPFRPSKQLFDHIVNEYSHSGSTKRAFDDSAREPEPQNIGYKFVDPSFSNILILPPEPLTFKFNEDDNATEEIQSTKDNKSKQKQVDDILTYKPSINEAYDSKNIDVNQRGNLVSKPKEIHYHRHKHRHEYDMNVEYRNNRENTLKREKQLQAAVEQGKTNKPSEQIQSNFYIDTEGEGSSRVPENRLPYDGYLGDDANVYHGTNSRNTDQSRHGDHRLIEHKHREEDLQRHRAHNRQNRYPQKGKRGIRNKSVRSYEGFRERPTKTDNGQLSFESGSEEQNEKDSKRVPHKTRKYGSY